MTSSGFTYAFLIPMTVSMAIIVVVYIIVLYHVVYKRSNGKVARSRSGGNKINVSDWIKKEK